jgi:hypothetical protein
MESQAMNIFLGPGTWIFEWKLSNSTHFIMITTFNFQQSVVLMHYNMLLDVQVSLLLMHFRFCKPFKECNKLLPWTLHPTWIFTLIWIKSFLIDWIFHLWQSWWLTLFFVCTVPAKTLIRNSTHISLMTIQYIIMFHIVH